MSEFKTIKNVGHLRVEDSGGCIKYHPVPVLMAHTFLDVEEGDYVNIVDNTKLDEDGIIYCGLDNLSVTKQPINSFSYKV